MLVSRIQVAEKIAILSRRTVTHGRYLLDHKLRIFDTAKFVHIQFVRKLHNTSIDRACLIKGDSIHCTAAINRPDPQLEVIIAYRSLLKD